MQKTTFPIEIIIHDDASKDRTADIIRMYEKRYPGLIIPIYQRENQYSKGIKPILKYVYPKVRGKYIAICEGDDYWTDPCKLQKQVDFLESNEDFAICFHKVKVQKDNDLFDDYITKVPAQITTIEELSKGNFIHTCSSVFRGDLLKIPKWFDSKLNASDYPIHLILADKGKIFYIDHCMSVYRVHPGGIYSNAKEEVLLRGNIYLLKILVDNFNNNTVKANIRSQLRSTLNVLYLIYLNNKRIIDCFLLVIMNFRYFNKKELYISSKIRPLWFVKNIIRRLDAILLNGYLRKIIRRFKKFVHRKTKLPT